MMANDKRWETKYSKGQPRKAGKRDKSSAMHSDAGFLVGFLVVASTVLFAGFLVLLGFLALAVTAHAGTGNLPEAAKGIPAALPLPDSLNAFYPPAADRPVYLFKMLGLETSFSGIVVDLMEEDLEGARGSFEDFQKQYREVASMVPEWSREYPEKPVKDLGAALAIGNKSDAMNAFAAVGVICHRCHAAAMVPVQQKYHWGDFSAITVKDPLSGESTGYPQFKKYLASNLAGMTINLRQGQTDNARRQFEGFRERFAALGDSCRGCHEKESRYFVDREMQDAVAELGRVFKSRSVPADAVAALAQKIGRESCSKCHLVHVPAALSGVSRR